MLGVLGRIIVFLVLLASLLFLASQLLSVSASLAWALGVLKSYDVFVWNVENDLELKIIFLTRAGMKVKVAIKALTPPSSP